MANPTYKMTLSLNVLNHLGINLYSNVPAVIAETIANAWDADADEVNIEIKSGVDKVVITDDGHGMSIDDINNKYLFVGYGRREKGEGVTAKYKRDVMGRKGIGKLSLFSIAANIEVHSVKEGVKAGFRMKLADIKEKIEGGTGDYNPEPIPTESIAIEKGTRIILTDLKKNVIEQTETGLRMRLARRFSVISPGQNFSIKINDTPLVLDDRGYFPKIQCVWHYGEEGSRCMELCKNAELNEARSDEIPGTDFKVSGWIGTVKESGSLKVEGESQNKIVVMVRGKLAQEDILDEFGETGVYKTFVLGEIHADFLDTDQDIDIATSSRQKVLETDPRYQALKSFLHDELKNIQKAWNDFRDGDGMKKAEDIPAIKTWLSQLPKDDRQKAKSLFGKINRLALDSEDDRKRLFKSGILAFESLRYKQSLDQLDHLDVQDMVALGKVFSDLNDIEATLYHQIVSERISVITALIEKVDENVLEKVLQEHLFNQLWLLDPSWERATETPYFEQSVQKEFENIDAGLTPEEKAGRVDIKYTTTAGKHVIIELKRPARRVSSAELIEQIDKYRSGLKKVLTQVGKGDEPIECVCVVGADLKDWDQPNGREESEEMLKAKHTRVIGYQELIHNAQKAYKKFLEKQSEAGRITKIIQDIDEWGLVE